MVNFAIKLLTSLNKLAKFKDSPVITAGSICTGWGVGDMVIDAVNANLNRMCEDAPKARMGFGGGCRRFSFEIPDMFHSFAVSTARSC